MHSFGRNGVGGYNDFIIVRQHNKVSSIKTIVNKVVVN